jgi:hypothetical protein
MFARAAEPTEGTVSPSHPTVTWTGGPLTATGTTRNAASIDTVNQEVFKLTIDVPDAYWASHPLGAVRAKVTFPAGDDYDVAVFPDGQSPAFTRSSTLRGGTVDAVTLLKPKRGTYVVRVTAFRPSLSQEPFSASADLLNLSSPLRSAQIASPIEFQANTIVDKPAINTGEPNVAVDSKGRIYVTAPGAGVAVYRSDDGGVTFKKLGDFDADFGTPAVGPVPAQSLGGGDADIQIDKHDNIYIADLAVVSINVLKSTDHGQTFPQRAITGYESDRQWLATYGEDTVYLGYHDITLEQELVYKSTDGGATFTQITPVQVDATSLRRDAAGYTRSQADCLENTFSGPVAVDQKDETIYIVYGCSNVTSNLTGRTPPYGPANRIFVGVSRDGGLTFTNHEVLHFNAGANAANLFPSMTLDNAGNAYVVVAKADREGGPSDVLMTTSTNHGETWSAPVQVSSGTGTRMFPWIAAGNPGRVDVVWAGTATDTSDDVATPAVWHIEMAQSLNALSASPTFTESRVSDHPIHLGQVCTAGILCSLGGDRTLLDFIEVGIDPDGRANVAWTENAGGVRHLGFSRQTSGPSLYGSGTNVLSQRIKRPAPKPAAEPKANPERLPATGAEDARVIAVVVMALGALLGRRVRFRVS